MITDNLIFCFSSFLHQGKHRLSGDSRKHRLSGERPKRRDAEQAGHHRTMPTSGLWLRYAALQNREIMGPQNPNPFTSHSADPRPFGVY